MGIGLVGSALMSGRDGWGGRGHGNGYGWCGGGRGVNARKLVAVTISFGDSSRKRRLAPGLHHATENQGEVGSH